MQCCFLTQGHCSCLGTIKANLPNPLFWHKVLHQYLSANTCNRKICLGVSTFAVLRACCFPILIQFSLPLLLLTWESGGSQVGMSPVPQQLLRVAGLTGCSLHVHPPVRQPLHYYTTS
jgi:hypothetical protein